MAQTSLIIGDTNWAVKEDSLLGYNVIQDNYLPIPIDCVRATTATRVNEQGLIEIVPRNLLEYSEQFDNAYWNKLNTIVTVNSTTAPNGTLTAETFTTSNVNAAIDQNVSFLNPSTISIYIKYIDSQFIQLYTGFSGQTRANFDILNGVLGDKGTETSNSTIQSVGNGWFRITATFINYSGASNIRIRFVASLTAGWGTNSTNAVNSANIWGAQLEQGSVATEYFPTTNRLDIPRIDYSTGTASLLVEPQRTNLILRSQEFNLGIWGDFNQLSLTANAGISPDGTNNAFLFTKNTGNTVAWKTQGLSVITGTTYTLSCFVKKGTLGNKAILRFAGSGFPPAIIYEFNFDTETITNGGSFTKLSNGWYKISGQRTATSTASADFQIGVTSGLAADLNNVLIWGAQLEAGSYATSYIPTIASSVTRNADVISKTDVSGLIGQTEGTMFCEINLPNPLSSGGKTIVVIGTSGNRVYISKEGTTTNFFQLATQSASGFNFINSSVITTSKVKFAIAYKGGDNAFYVNGSLISSASAVANPTSFSNLLIGDSTPETNTDIKINSVQLYKTRLTNSELQLLTTI